MQTVTDSRQKPDQQSGATHTGGHEFSEPEGETKLI